MKLVIVGGVAGGASAAARARRLCEKSEIVMFERGPYISFANCGLPYHIGGDIPSRDDLLLQTPESFKARFNVDVRTQTIVTSINPQKRTVTVRDARTGREYTEAYDRLILSPGAAPLVPPIPGLNDAITRKRAFTLRNVPDMDAIIQCINSAAPRHVTVIGGGFIGLEMAEAAKLKGLSVTIIEKTSQLLPPIDAEMATYLHDEARGHDVALLTGHEVTAVATDPALPGAIVTVARRSGEVVEVKTDMLLVCIGVRPEIGLAKAAGLKIGALGGVQVDPQQRTSDPHIYAVGDAVETQHFTTETPVFIPLAGPANRQGRLAANDIFQHRPGEGYRRTQGTAICKFFDLAAGSVGLSEKVCASRDIPYLKVVTHGPSHAGYYPGAKEIHLKLLFSPKDGKILGAQAVGEDGVDKRIDVIAVAQRAGMTVFDLQDLELSYAPPYGSAKDVVNQIGFVAANLLKGDISVCHYEDIAAAGGDQIVVDVRTRAEFAEGSVPQAVNIPVDELRERLGELPKDKEVLVYCRVGMRGHVALTLLKNMGYNVRNLTGGYKTYVACDAAAKL